MAPQFLESDQLKPLAAGEWPGLLNLGAQNVPSEWREKVVLVENKFAPDFDRIEWRNAALALMRRKDEDLWRMGFGLKGAAFRSDLENGAAPALGLEGKSILIAGTGPGREFDLAILAGASVVVGVDPAGEYLTLIQERFASGEVVAPNLGAQRGLLIQAGIEELGPELIPNTSVDGVSSLFSVFDYIEDQERGLANIARMLIPGGVFVFSVSAPTEDGLVYKRLENGLSYEPSILQRRTEGGLLLPCADGTRQLLPAKYATPAWWVNQLERNGLEVQQVHGFLRLAALYPREDWDSRTVEALRAELADIDPEVARAVQAVSVLGEDKPLLRALGIWDEACADVIPSDADSIREYAYYGIIARKRN